MPLVFLTTPHVGSVKEEALPPPVIVKNPVSLTFPVTAASWEVPCPETVSDPVIVTCEPDCATFKRADTGIDAPRSVAVSWPV